ncbi:MAG: VWA domain-containing protein [Nanoarchaeota archaeon]
MVLFDSESDPFSSVTFQKTSEIEELSGKLASQDDEDKLMHTVLEGDKEALDEGKIITESINQSLGSFTPEIMFKNMVKDFKQAKNLYGETLIRLLAGYDPKYVQKNISIPEFQRQIQTNIEKKVKDLKDKDLLDKDGVVTEKALTVSSLVMYLEELRHIIPRGFGEKKEKKRDVYGDREGVTSYHKSRYRDIAIRPSIKAAIRRHHKELEKEDLRIFERRKKGKISIIYALDASGSMKGQKINVSKKAGIALAFKAIEEKNKVGLIVFGDDVKVAIEPTLDFKSLLHELIQVRASNQTNLSETIRRAIELFPRTNETKHLILLTDAIPTTGEDPIKETLEAASLARDSKITISLIGIRLDEPGLKLAREITEVGNGRLIGVRNLDALDRLILEDYDAIASGH